MEDGLPVPEVAFRHNRMESSAIARLALGVGYMAIADEAIVRDAGQVMANGEWDYRQSSTAPTPLDTDYHEPTFLYRGALGKARYEFIEHETEGRESIDGKELYCGTVTLSNRGDMGRAVLSMVRNGWDGLDIQLQQATSRQNLAAAEKLRLDEASAFDLLTELLHLSDEDPATAQDLHSLEDIFTMLTHRAAKAETTNTLKQNTLCGDYGSASVLIEEKTAKVGKLKPTVTHKIGVIGTHHLQQTPTVTTTHGLQFATRLSDPKMVAFVATHLALPSDRFMAPARREDVLREASRKYLDPDGFIGTIADQLQLVRKVAKK